MRELKHVIERAVVLSPAPPLRLDRALPEVPTLPPESPPTRANQGQPSVLTDAELHELERRNLLMALEKAGWVIAGESGAAELLGIRPSTLRDRMRSFGITPP